MPAPLTAQQIALYMSKRRAGSRQEVAAAAAGISVSSAHRIDSGRLQPKAAKPRGRRRPDLSSDTENCATSRVIDAGTTT